MTFQSSSHISIAFTHIRKGVARLTARYKQRPSSQENPFGPLGGRTTDEQRRRAFLLQDLCRDYWTETTDNEDLLTHTPTPPPDWWLNEKLEVQGQGWRVHSIDGFRYEVYDLDASGDGRGSPRAMRPGPR